MAVYGNAEYQAKSLAGAGKELERQPPLADQLRTIYEQLAMAHNALDELEHGPQLEKGSLAPSTPEPYGVFDTAQRALDSAQKLRDRVQTIAGRLGRL
jgi:hypothetical protein